MKVIGYIHKLIYYACWITRCKLLNRRIPLTCSLIINDACNLACKHCIVANLGYPHLTFRDLQQQVDTLYNLGGRILVITGGEPFLWKDGPYTLDDVIDYAKAKGFFRTVVCTNGTLGLQSCADYLWVSLDGLQPEHGKLRGDGIYHKVINNILTSDHKNIYINFTISKINLEYFEEAIRYILRHEQIKGVLVHLITPYLGLEKSNILLSRGERTSALHRLLQLKWQYPVKISNTFAGIKALIADTWERPIWASVLINQHKLDHCCCREEIYNEDVCRLCGCSAAVETWVLQQLKPSAIIEYLRFL